MSGRSRIASVVLLAVIAGVLAPSVGVADRAPDFGMTVPGSVDVPTRTVTVDGDEFTVSNVGRRFPGETLEVEVTAPGSDTAYDVNLYNSDSKIEASDAMTGSGTATFDTDSLTAGLYYAGVYHDGSTVQIHPVVVGAYELTVDVPTEARSGATVTATVSVTRRTRDRPPNFLQVLIGDESRDIRVNATRESSGTYTAEFAVDLPPGEYVAYGVARGSNETDEGEATVIGISNGHTVQVNEATSTATNSGGGGGGDGGGGDTPGPGTATGSPTSGAPGPGTATGSPTSGAPGTPGQPGSTSTSTDGADTRSTPASNDTVITPGPGTTGGTTTTGPVAGFGPAVAAKGLVALAVLIGVLHRSR